jgi:hypothetical protein
MTQQTQQSIVVIDTKTQLTRNDLLDVITELKTIVKQAIEALN